MTELLVEGPDTVVVGVNVGLSSTVVLTDEHAVIRGKDDDGVIEQPQLIDLVHDVSDPLVDQVGFSCIVSLQIGQFLSGVDGCGTVVGVDHRRAVVARVVVALDQVLGRVPGLVDVEEVDP